uniref:hypothetical protein Ycf1 n=1 Tax=Striga asiatica TaxID=4170 RepID=UPI002206071A|nr:hypothetical protein Ycf1 [Striga asiatica]YP_010516343.1 hypothetical protein Ycf1 [Striga asiatica]UXL88485.1 hypothetical protein Ycf1 [Striga asiatica]UXL88503.1 hypothetical protein Ycf1 [Striga asiatica]
MIFQSFLLGNLAPLCIKISNSVVVVGLYYGFLTTFSIGPSYLFLLGTQIIEKEPEKKVSAATGFIMGQLVMFISIYYAPLHLALGRPHTITFLGLLYLLFQFFWNNFHQDETWYWTYEIVTETTMFSIQCVFLNHLIFQLFNHCLFAGSMLARLVNIDMFRCNNKMLFVISSFVGWLIGHILFTKWLGLVFVWMQKNPSIRRIIRENRYKYFIYDYVDLADYLEFRSQYVSLILVITCCYYLNKMPSPIAFKFTEAKEKTATYGEKARREIEWWKEGEERDVEIERADNSRFKKNQKPKNRISFEEILISFFFDPNRPGRPIRYVKEAVRTEISQYFFDICKSDENERISFTSTPSLSIFLEMIKKRISGKKASPSNPWRYHLKRKGFTDDLLYRIKGLDEKSRPLNMLETRTRLCKNPYTKEYFAKKYDPFLSGSSRKTIDKSKNEQNSIFKKTFSAKIQKKLLVDKSAENFGTNRIYRILLGKYLKKVATDVIDQKNLIKSTRIRIKELRKKVFWWLYRLFDDLELAIPGETDDEKKRETSDIRTRKAMCDIEFDTQDSAKASSSTNQEKEELLYFLRYIRQHDWEQDIIKGSLRTLRRKVATLTLYYKDPNTPLFFPYNSRSLFSVVTGNIFTILYEELSDLKWSEILSKAKAKREKIIEKIWGKRKEKSEHEEIEEIEAEVGETETTTEERRMDIVDSWDFIPHGMLIRSGLLCFQCLFRMYGVPLLIIAKNFVRLLLFQPSELYEDFEEFKKEQYVLCSFYGLPFEDERAFLSSLYDGIQIQIIMPFHLRPWNTGLQRQDKENICYLTVYGKETDFPFGWPRRNYSFFRPIFHILEKKWKKISKKPYFLALRIFKRKIKPLLKPILFRLRKVFKIKKFKKVELSKLKEKEKKASLINNQITHESFNQIESSINSLLLKKMKDSTDQTNTIRNQIQIERISKENEKGTPRINNLSSVKKTNLNVQIFEKWKVLKRQNARRICKLPLFLEFFIERIYPDIFLYSIKNLKMKTEIFLELIKESLIIYKSISTNERKQEKIKKKKTNRIPFISKSRHTISNSEDSNSEEDSYTCYDLSDVSQAYVFYKLAKIQVSNSDKLRSLLHYQEIPFFLKPEIKDSLERRGAVHSKLGEKKLPSSEMNQWKNWLRGHYQYNLSQINWSKLIPEKWRNRVRQCHIANKEILSKRHSYEKDQLVDSKKQKKWEVYSLDNKKKHFQKDARYDLLSSKFLNYETKMECFFYISPFQGNKKQEISYTSKKTFFNMLRNIPIKIKNYLNNNLGREKTADRKYFDCKILDFDLRQKIDIRDQNTQILTKNLKRIYKTKKDVCFMIPEKNPLLPEKNPPNSPEVFFDWMGMGDWMGMNEKMLKRPRPNGVSFFFLELVSFSSAYKMKPWSIPSKLLLLNLNRKKILKEKPEEEKPEEEKPEEEKPEEEKPEEKKPEEEEKFGKSGVKKETKYKIDRQREQSAELIMQNEEFQVDWDLAGYYAYNLIWQLDKTTFTLVKVKGAAMIHLLTFLIRMYKRRTRIRLMFSDSFITLPSLLTEGIIYIEHRSLPEKQDGQFIMYQTIGISSIPKSQDQTNQNYQEQGYLSKNHFDEAISTHQRIIENRDKSRFDFPVPENILSFRRRRKLRILICFKPEPKTRNDIDRNRVFWNEKKKKSSTQVSRDNKHLDRDKNQLLKLKLFLWPNYRLEDLACMNRYWFDTNNGSRFSMLRVYLYPRLKKKTLELFEEFFSFDLVERFFDNSIF